MVKIIFVFKQNAARNVKWPFAASMMIIERHLGA